MDAEPDPLAPGTRIAPHYLLIGLLRRGNHLDVYNAWSTERACRCVIKTPRSDRLDSRRSIDALLSEGRLLARLAHPHLVRCYAVLERPLPAVILETLSGETMNHLVARSGALSDEEVAHLGLQLGSAVQYLHRHGVLHLDLKPSNVITQSGVAKLIDLHLARPPGLAHAGVGTWCYMAPEQARGGELTEAADVWGLGTILYEALAGEVPFDADTGSDEDYYPQLEGRAGRLAKRSGVLGELVDACLEPKPSRRPSMAALFEGLELAAQLPESERLWSQSN